MGNGRNLSRLHRPLKGIPQPGSGYDIVLLALHVTPADAQDRAQVAQLTAQVQDVTGEAIEVAFVDQGSTGADSAQDAAVHGIHLEVVKRPEAKKGFVLLPRRWVAERSFA